MNVLQIITTADGSPSLFNAKLDETYHSKHGAVQESQHVFISHGLRHWLNRSGHRQVVIFEMGFGTGLNAWLTHQVALADKLSVTYISLEAYPLSEYFWAQLQYSSQVEPFRKLHEAPWNEPVALDEQFTLHKIHGSVENLRMSWPVDVIYYDAFAPSKQPELWTLPILANVCSTLNKQGVFVTYCAKGQLKRDLRSLGLITETLPGPPGKKEMVRASNARAER